MQAMTWSQHYPPSAEEQDKMFEATTFYALGGAGTTTIDPLKRPQSTATEIYIDSDDDGSEFEEHSLHSSAPSFDTRRRSQTTISTFEEAKTPRSPRGSTFELPIMGMASMGMSMAIKPVEGPRGPHLFRASQGSFDFPAEYALQMSPIALKHPPPMRSETAPPTSQHLSIATAVPPATFYAPSPAVENKPVEAWDSHEVAAWLAGLGLEDSVIETFELNDISGSVLLDLKMDDLKELEIASLGKRHALWAAIDHLRGENRPASPAPTPFQDTNTPCASRSRSKSRGARGSSPSTRTPSRRRRGRRAKLDDVVLPGESVSIVAIEQLMPKPHTCAKGERCAKWRKQQRLYEKLKQEHGFPISPTRGGHIFIAGNPGDGARVPANDDFLPSSDNIPSIVASSDLMGPGELPEFTLQADMLRQLESRDPQENVKNFLSYQHIDQPSERPVTPPLEMFPSLYPHQSAALPPHSNLKMLPKLAIPNGARSASTGLGTSSATLANSFSPCQTAVTPGAYLSPRDLYRMGTPASEMDVPVTAVPLDPIGRDVSQSIPPNMQFRPQVQRSNSRVAHWHRPSFAMPILNEGQVYAEDLHNGSPITAIASDSELTPVVSREEFVATSSNASSTTQVNSRPSTAPKQSQDDGTVHAGWMKKRKTKLLRHEWNEHHFRLRGTELGMYTDATRSAAALQTIDVDDYAVACSSLPSSNKLTAKLRAMNLGNGNDKKGGPTTSSTASGSTPFAFQLVPATVDKDGRERERRAAALFGGKSTHHFAVPTRDERLDWMRELMLAKALKQKSDGYEVKVNGAAV